jgi:class 3 adenylate cyclase
MELLDSLKYSFENYQKRDSLNTVVRKSSPKYFSASDSGDRRFIESNTSMESTQLIPQYSLQKIVRPIFGMQGIANSNIGNHPDFEHLNGTTNTVYNSITTMFMDIDNSTRLGIILPLEDVFLIKNAFIRTAIDIINSFNGHVHRIMGDAVLAFWGGISADDNLEIINALNCASLIRYFVDRTVIPALRNNGYDEDFGIRIGLDYGEKNHVLWSSYGYLGIDEVTATSFYVDVASKLQHQAGKNQIMLGDSLKRKLDFPDVLLNIKTTDEHGQKAEEKYLIPNYTDKYGRKINYRKYIFKWKEYLRYTPLSQYDRDYFETGAMGFTLEVEYYTKMHGNKISKYYPCANYVEKDKGLRFRLHYNFNPRLPIKVVFSVENHGKESEEIDNNGNHKEEYYIKDHRSDGLIHWEETAYSGLHFLFANIHLPNGGTERLRAGVYIYD